MIDHERSDEVVDDVGVERLDRAGGVAVLDGLLADVVAHDPAVGVAGLVVPLELRRARRHRVTFKGPQLALEKVRVCPAGRRAAGGDRHHLVDLVPQRARDDGVVQAVMDFGYRFGSASARCGCETRRVWAILPM
jgi:hypothetical protein